MVELSQEQDLETLRQISLLLDRENQRLITKTLELTAEVARLQGLPSCLHGPSALSYASSRHSSGKGYKGQRP